jgi:hypothetical protein
MGSSRIACAIVLALAAGAAAQPPTDQQKQAAGDLVKQAIAKSQAGDHQGAIDSYMNAYEIIPMAVLLSNIATEYQRLHKSVDALKYFCKYLDREPTGDSASYASAQAKVLAIELGNRNADEATVCKPAPVKPPETGTGSGAGAGTGTGAGPRPPNDAVVAPSPRPASNKTLQYAGIGTAGAGVVALGVGIYFGIHAQNISDYITNYTINNPGKPWPSNINQMENDGKSAQTSQIVFDIVGPIAIVAGGVMIWLGRSHKTESSVTVAPVVTPSSSGLVVSGRF